MKYIYIITNILIFSYLQAVMVSTFRRVSWIALPQGPFGLAIEPLRQCDGAAVVLRKRPRCNLGRALRQEKRCFGRQKQWMKIHGNLHSGKAGRPLRLSESAETADFVFSRIVQERFYGSLYATKTG